jgi:hypothetical protein
MGVGGDNSWGALPHSEFLNNPDHTHSFSYRLTPISTQKPPAMELSKQSFSEPYVPSGDVNTDGSVNIIDALVVARYHVGLNPSPFDPNVADVNCNGTIDIIDALLIARYYVGLITQFC